MRTCDIAIIFTLSLMFRVAFVIPALLDPSAALGPPHLDTHEYYALGQSITRGSYEIGGFDWILRPPGYPAFLAWLDVSLGRDPRFAVGLQVLLGGLVAVLVGIWAGRGWGRSAGLASGILAGLAPVTGLLSGFLLTEALFAATAAVGLFFTEKRPAISGFILGLSALVRPMGIYIALVAAGFHLIQKDWVKAGLLGLAFSLPILPWLARNKILNGKPILSTQHEATVFLYAAPYTMMEEKGISYEKALAELSDTLGCPDLQAAALDPMLAGEVAKRGIRYILRHPRAYSIAHLKGFVRGFFGLGRDFTRFLWGDSPAAALIVLFSWLYALFTYILAGWGFSRMGREGLALAFLIFLLLFLPGPDGSFRFRAPAEPILALASGIGLVSLKEKVFP